MEAPSDKPLLPQGTTSLPSIAEAPAIPARAGPSSPPQPPAPAVRIQAPPSGEFSQRPVPRLSSFITPNDASVDIHLKPQKLSSGVKTLGNMLVSIIGAGVLGLPYAFRKSGWAFSIVALATMALISWYGMLLLVKTRKLLEQKLLAEERGVLGAENLATSLGSTSSATLPSRDSNDAASEGLLSGKPKTPPAVAVDERPDYHLHVTSYGDLGYKVMGTAGQVAVDVMICISQSGFCVAYLIFIGQNVSSVLVGTSEKKVQVVACTAVIQILLSWMRSLSRLAPFSIFADVVNLCAFSVIIYYGVLNLSAFPSLAPFTSLANAPAALGVAVYSFEGVGMTLALEGGMKEPARFPTVLSCGVGIIASAYGLVGMMGYVAFGEHTHQIVTLNLPVGWATTVVKLGLSLALCFTFPVMMHPVYAVYETRLCQQEFVRSNILPSTFLRRLMFRSLRGAIICLVALVSVGVPHFSTFISLIGSSVCSLLGFVFPAIFHLRVGSGIVSSLERLVDYALIAFGVSFGTWGTLDSIRNLFW